MSAVVGLLRTAARDDDAGDAPTGGIGLQLDHLGLDEQRHVRRHQQRPHGDRLGVGLGVDHARIAVAPRAADARAAGPVGFVEEDPARRRERVVAGGGQVVGDLLDARFVGDGRPRVLLRPVTLGRVVAVVAVDLVQPLRLGVPGLEVVVAHRPGRRDAVGVLDLTEVLRAQPVEGGAVQLRRPADEVVDLRLERLAVGVVPGVGRDVLAVEEHRLGVPVLASRAGGSCPVRAAGSACPTAARVWARVPPPAPVPMTMTS